MPQNVDQFAFSKMFSMFGEVEKAWLQMFHGDERHATTRKHRGFGFVIFRDIAAIERLLGDDYSKFVFINATKLEVKRAVSMFDMPSSMQDQGLSHGSCTMEECPKSALPADHTTHLDGSTLEDYQSRWSLPASSTCWQNRLPASQTWQSHPCFYLPTPSAQQCPSVGYELRCPAGEEMSNGYGMSCPQGVYSRGPEWSVGDIPIIPNPHDVLLDGIVGLKPRTQQELESMLREAMPEHYDD